MPSKLQHTVQAGWVAPHPSLRRESLDVVGYMQQGPDDYSQPYLESVSVVHQRPTKWFERLAWWWLLAVRTFVGLLTGTLGRQQEVTERQLARRAQLFNCDGQATAFAAVLMNHARSVLRNAPDSGWVHTLAMEVDCMRCQHAMWSQLVAPTVFERVTDLLITANLLFQCCLVYGVAPSVIHAYQVYRAEEDMWWLGSMLQLMAQRGRLPSWEAARAPLAAQAYYALPASASLKDVLWRMRADEASIRHINHQLAGLTPGTPTSVVAVRQFGSQ